MKLSAYFIISLYVMSINFSLILTQNEMITNTDILPYKPPSIASEHETEIIPKSAKAHTYFKWGFLMWSTMSYLPENAISTHQNHWQSSKNVKDDYWEAIFSFSQKIDQILIKWKNPPKNFKIFYQQNSFTKYLPATNIYTIKSNDELIHSINFHIPIIAEKVRIVLNTPFNNKYFAINKVFFYQKEHTMMIINNNINLDNNQEDQLCFYINNDTPQINSLVEAYSCSKVLMHYTNNELFRFDNTNHYIIHINSNLCLSLSKSNDIVLNKCNTSTQIIIKEEGKISFKVLPENYIFINKEKFVNFLTYENCKLETTSTAMGYIYRKENVIYNDDSYWMSSPGEEKVSFIISFNNEKIIEIIRISWLRPAKKFKIYTKEKQGDWVARREIKDNEDEINVITLIDVKAEGVMIKMEESFHNSDIGYASSYAIKEIFCGYNGYKLGYVEKKKTNEHKMIFDFVPQYNVKYTTISNKSTINMLKYYEEILKIYKNVYHNNNEIKEVKELNQQLIKMLHIIENHENFIIEKYLTFYQAVIANTNIKMNNNMKSSLTTGTLDSPGTSCLEIKEKNSFIQSGFYYIQPECYTQSPIKVYCDFSSYGQAVDILIYNDDNSPNTDISYLGINDYKDIKDKCGYYGLYPIEIKNNKMIESIYKIMNKLGFNMNSGYIVPLGYTYDKDKKYSSINSINSKEFFISKNKENFPYTGFAYGKTLDTFDISNKHINALICSSNNFEKTTDKSVAKISCGMKMKNNDSIFHSNVDLIILCPAKCKSSSKEIQLINGIYYDNSISICEAAIHSGAIWKDKGGKFILRKIKENYIIKKYYPKCPKLEVNKSFTSFIETEALIDINDLKKENIKTEIEKASNQTKSSSSIIASEVEKNINYLRDAFNQNTNDIMQYQNQYDSLMQEASGVTNEEKEKNDIKEEPASENIVTGNKDDFEEMNARIPPEFQDPKEEDDAEKIINLQNIIKQTTSSIMREINAFHSEGIEMFLKEIKTKITKIFTQVEYFNNESSETIYYEKIKEKYEKLLQIYIKLLKFFDVLFLKAKMRIKINNKIGKENLITQLSRIENRLNKEIIINTECNDENEIFSKFEIKNEEKLKLSLINRRNGIGPLGKEINKITIKNKMWRDFESKMSLFISSQEYSKEGNQGGIMFRYKNEFNYYLLNINCINHSVKFIKVMNGNYSLISKKILHSLKCDQWFDIELNIIDENFYFKYKEDFLEGKDSFLKNGKVGFESNEPSKMYLGNMKIQKSNKSENKKKNDLLSLEKIRNNNVNYYLENFKNQIDTKYIISHQEYKNDWNIDYIKKQITHLSISHSSFLLLQNKHLSYGKFTISFSLLSSPSNNNEDENIKVVFNYKNIKDYFYFQISKSSLSLKHYQGNDLIRTLLSKSNDLQLNSYTSYTISIESYGDYFAFYYGDVSNYKEIFKYKYQIKKEDYLLVGFGASKLKVKYTFIQITPILLQFTKNDINFIINSNTISDKKKIIFPSISSINLSYYQFHQSSNEIVSLQTKISSLKSSLGNINLSSSDFNQLSSLSIQTELQKNQFIQNNISVQQCSKYKTTSERAIFCSSIKTEFDKQRCNYDFCSYCCEEKLPKYKSFFIHHCSKACHKSLIAESIDEIDYEDICFSSSSYYYTQCNKVGNDMENECKVDMCKLCCSSLDKIKNRIFEYSSIAKCQIRCEKFRN